MISFKKSYAEQMLQLALALSLLQVDPENYLGSGWDSHLDMRNGDAWELEMLRAVPMTEYPYANRKAMIPLIEDLVRYDRQSSNYHDITAYLLNVQNAQGNQTASIAIPGQNYTSTSSTQATSTTTNTSPTANSGEPSLPSPTFNENVNELELFLNSDHFQNQIPLFEQNLADLREYEDLTPTSSIYANLPLKDEPWDLNAAFEMKIESFSESDSAVGSDPDFNYPNSRTRTNESFDDILSWANLQNLFKEEDEDIELTNKTEKCDNDKVKSENDKLANDVQSIIEKQDEGCSSGASDDSILNKEELLIKEESEIVEVLWKQDVDLGYSPPKPSASDATTSKNILSDDEEEKLKALENIKDDKKIFDDETKKSDDEWDGLQFTIDNETGEYIWQSNVLQLDEILQDVLQLSDLNKNEEEEEKEKELSSSRSTADSEDKVSEITEHKLSEEKDVESTAEEDIDFSSELPSPLFDFDEANELEEEFDRMIQSAGPFHQPHRSAGIGQNYGGTNSAFRQSAGFHHHHHHQARVPLNRGVSMEQRLQDIASLFNPIPSMGVGDMAPYSHYPNPYYHQGAPMHQHSQFPHHSVLHNASLAELGGTTQPHYGHNLGSAVTSSMHLTNSSHENDPGATAYKMEHEMMYYSNASSDLNHTADGFINSILNDEDLQLMDMGVNENFCSMRMIDSNATSNNSSVLGTVTSNHIPHSMSTAHHHLRNGLGISSADNGLMGSSLGSDGMGSTGTTTDRLDASSDSAVSSMGSERVPSLSDGEWGEGSDSAQDYHQGKYSSLATGAHDYTYNRMTDGSRHQPPVAQKKHQMYGKRYFQEQPISNNLSINSNIDMNGAAAALPGPIKYEYDPYASLHHPHHTLEGAVGLSSKEHEIKYGHWSLDFGTPPAQPLRTPRTPHDLINHNHTYTLPQGTGSVPRPQTRDKKISKKMAAAVAAAAAAAAAEDEHLTRDEKRARSLNIPIPVTDVINLPMDEFNERLSKYDLTENQLSLIRDIRRRGKNKVAAQNCRKRKLDQILSLEDEVREVRRKKDQYYSERDILMGEKNRISNKFSILHRHIFQYLRDPDGNLCSPTEYSLQQAADGSVYLLRRDTNKPVETNNQNAGSTIANNSNNNNPASNSYDPNQHYHNHTTTQHRPSSHHHHNHHQKE